MPYKLNKSLSKQQSFTEAERANKIFWRDKTPEERLKASWYLTCQAWGLLYSTDRKLDKTVFSSRKHAELGVGNIFNEDLREFIK